MIHSREWRIAAASATGTSHAKQGTPCQDAFAVKWFHEANGDEILVVAVSDGAGSATKSEIGSWLACTTILEAIEVYFIDGGTVSQLDRATTETWIAMVQRAIEFRAESDAGISRDYACTLLVAIVGRNVAAVMQIGDGAVVVADGDGWCWVHWPQHGEYTNTTFFVTEPQACERLAFDLCERRIEEIAIFTDGIERLALEEKTKTVFAGFFDNMFPAVRKLEVPGLNVSLSTALDSYLGSPAVCARTDDDKTLVLASRRPAFTAAIADNNLSPKSGDINASSEVAMREEVETASDVLG